MRHSSHALTAKSGLVSELALQLIAYYPAHLPYPPKNAQYALEAVPENDSCKDFMDEAESPKLFSAVFYAHRVSEVDAKQRLSEFKALQ